jgi:hypothetical protein
MVYPKTEITSNIFPGLIWKEGVSFKDVPFFLIDQLPDRKFNWFEYRKWAEVLDKMPTYWTLGLFDGEEMIGFCYGTLNPLEREMEVKRATLDRERFSFKGDILKEAFSIIKEIAKKKGMLVIYMPTNHAKVFKRKLKDIVKETNINCLEVSLW